MVDLDKKISLSCNIEKLIGVKNLQAASMFVF